MESPVTVGHIVTGLSLTGQHWSTHGDRTPGKADKTTGLTPIPWDHGFNSHQHGRPTKEGLSKPVRGRIIPAGNVTGVTRNERFADVSTALALLSDRQLADLVEAATPVSSSGAGGRAGVLTVAGTTVFVKKAPLTELERRPENLRSTANLWGLPPWTQYGVGTPAFGVWREVAAHVMTTNWVLSGECPNFPLLYHWRVVDSPPPVWEDLLDVDKYLEYMHHAPGVRERVEALVDARAGVVMFMEHFPHTLHPWFEERLRAGEFERTVPMVERDLRSVFEFLERKELFHFDAHFGNILTDGSRLYVADFGLANSPRFDLSPEEREFLVANAGHDRSHVLAHMLTTLVRALGNVDTSRPRSRMDFIRDFTDETDFPPAAAEVLRRYRPVAVPFNEFYAALFVESRQTPYPRAALTSALARLDEQPSSIG
jgi:hypothetical protein